MKILIVETNTVMKCFSKC